MENFFDIHCHILPGIDDGSRSMEETVKMLSLAYESGTREILATPHFHPRRGHAPAEKVLKKVEEVQKIAAEKFPGLSLYPGNELYYCHDIIEKISDGEVLTLNNSSYVLVEFSFTEELRKIKTGLNRILMGGYSPVLAHVERYEELTGDWDALEELTEAGVYLQINAETLQGKLGMGKKRFVKKLLKEEMVSFVASDAHDAARRTPVLNKSAEYVQKKFGMDTVRRIFQENPRKVMENKLI